MTDATERPGTSLIRGIFVGIALAGGKVEAIAALEGSAASAARSFLALTLAVPAQLGLLLLGLAQETDWPEPLWRWFAAHGVMLALGAVAYPLLMRPIAHALERERFWALHVEAWNYAGLVQLGLFGAGALLAPLLPAPYGIVPPLAAGLFAIRIGFVVARAALRITPGQAMLVVLAELVLAEFLAGLGASLST